jgi:hypothetical protein
MSGEQEFRATTDQMLDLIERLRASERSKQNVDYGSPEFIKLAVEAERLSRIVFRWASMQLQMAGVAASAVSRGEQSPAPLAEVVPRRLDRILANWREAQLRLEIAKPGSPEASAAADDVERYREEYRATQSALVVEDAS